jgi:DNA-3-methyladenine glycosylase
MASSPSGRARQSTATERERLIAGLSAPPEAAARFLLGKLLIRRRGRRTVAARIVETEAYLGEADPAAHAYRGRRTPRTAPLFGPPGTVYVYLVYGMHHCLNIAVDREGVPGCVLIRAAELVVRRNGQASNTLSGPGRLCRALRLDTRDSGLYLFEPGARLTLADGAPPRRVAVTRRVGIRHAAAWPLRFFDPDSPAVSAPRDTRAVRAARPLPRERVDFSALEE